MIRTVALRAAKIGVVKCFFLVNDKSTIAMAMFIKQYAVIGDIRPGLITVEKSLNRTWSSLKFSSVKYCKIVKVAIDITKIAIIKTRSFHNRDCKLKDKIMTDKLSSIILIEVLGFIVGKSGKTLYNICESIIQPIITKMPISNDSVPSANIPLCHNLTFFINIRSMYLQ